MTMTKREELQAKREAFYRKLEGMGLSEISSYMLVNNYGYTFKYKGVRYDLRHWLNCYGASIDSWELFPKNEELNKAKEIIIAYDKEC